MFRKVISVLFMITFGLILFSCGSSFSNGGSGGGSASGSMTVSMASPRANATNVVTNPTIILGTNLPCAVPASGSIVLETSAGVVVPITTPAVASNGTGGSVITFFPVSALQSGTSYLVVVNGTLLSTTGVGAVPVTFMFTTGSGSGFTVNIAAPANNATLSTLLPVITLTSSTGFLSAANVGANVQLTRNGVAVTLPTPVLSGSGNTTATFTLTTPLMSSSAYTLTVVGGSNSGIQNAASAYMTGGNVTSSFNTGVMAMAYTTGGLNMDMVSSGDGINWSVNMLATNFQQFIVSGSNVLILGARGAVATPSASLLSSYQIQKFPTLTTQAMLQYASNGSGTVVGVGGTAGTGTVVYSTNNGASWTQLTLGGNTLVQVSYGNGIFVALDAAGNAYNSTNGIGWSGATATGLTAAATAPVMSFANGFFVAVTNSAVGTNVSSPNGTTWTAGTATGVAGNSLAFGTISGVNYWVIGENTGAIAYQVVATNVAPTGAWTQVASLVGANGIRSLAFGNSLFVGGALATGQIIYSSGSGGAPTAFTLVGTTPLGVTSVNSIGFGGTNGTTFVAVGSNGNIAVSTTAIATWAAATVTMPTAVAGQALAAGGFSSVNGVLYLGNNTFITGGNNSVVLTSTNGGTTWTYPANPPSIPANALASGNLTIGGVATPVQITVGNTGSIYYSTTNGAIWALATSGTIQNLNAVACGTENGTGICVAVGALGTILYSTNASTWTAATSSTVQNLNAIIYGNGMFVAAGAAGAITSSLNGTTWAAVTVSANAYSAVGYAMIGSTPVFVAVGAAGQISFNNQSSSSSVGTFTPLTVSANAYNAITFGTVNGASQFLAVGAAGQVSRSLDGANWLQITAGALALVSVTNSPTLWMVAANNGTASAVLSIYTSPDGFNFSANTLPISVVVNAVSYFANLNTFIAVTAANGVLSSATSSNISSWASYLGLQGLVLSKLIGF